MRLGVTYRCVEAVGEACVSVVVRQLLGVERVRGRPRFMYVKTPSYTSIVDAVVQFLGHPCDLLQMHFWNSNNTKGIICFLTAIIR